MSERDYYLIELTTEEKEVLRYNFILVLDGIIPNKPEYYDEESYRDMYRYCYNRLEVMESNVKKEYKYKGAYELSDNLKRYKESFNVKQNEHENDRLVKFWGIPIVLSMLLFVSMFDLPYGFYTFLRISVFILSLWFAFYCYARKDKFALILSLAIAILWNPIIPIYLNKEAWMSLDFIAILAECILGIRSYKLWKRTMQEE